MQNKELEDLLQAKADNIEIREFSQVWDEIKDEIRLPEKEKKFKWKKWLPTFLASAAVVVCVALSPVIIKSLNPASPPEEVFYTDDLEKQAVEGKKDILSGLLQAQINHVNLDKYTLTDCKLLITETNLVKGASFTFCNDPTTFFAEMRMYDKTVNSNLDISTYDKTHKVKSTDVYYKSFGLNGEFYKYSVYTVHNNVQYVIEYFGVSENLTDFLNEFFA